MYAHGQIRSEIYVHEFSHVSLSPYGVERFPRVCIYTASNHRLPSPSQSQRDWQQPPHQTPSPVRVRVAAPRGWEKPRNITHSPRASLAPAALRSRPPHVTLLSFAPRHYLFMLATPFDFLSPSFFFSLFLRHPLSRLFFFPRDFFLASSTFLFSLSFIFLFPFPPPCIRRSARWWCTNISLDAHFWIGSAINELLIISAIITHTSKRNNISRLSIGEISRTVVVDSRLILYSRVHRSAGAASVHTFIFM